MRTVKHVVITGAGGMIGESLARAALDSGMSVTAIVRLGKTMSFSDAGMKVVECDISELCSLAVDNSADAFFHLAWAKTTGGGRDDAVVQELNIRYTLEAVKLAKRFNCSVFVGAGSQAEYGLSDKPLSGDSSVKPESGYGVAKYAAGKLSAMLCTQLGIEHCWARIFSVYGERDRDGSLVSSCVDGFLTDSLPPLTPCNQLWDYIYCDDAAGALLSIAERGLSGKTYCIGSGKCIPLREYVLMIGGASGNKGTPRFGERDYYEHQPMYLCADISELTEDTGFVPKVPFENGIKKVIEYRRRKLI